MQRACRLLPSDDALALALASACLGQDDAKAVELFARLAARYGGREAWTGLAIARRNIGDLVGAGEAVSRALATLVPDPTLASVAGLVAQQLAAPGWCGTSIDGVLDIRLTDGPCPIELEIDGQRRRKLNVGPSGAERVALPSAWWHIAHAVGVIADGRHLLGSPLEAHAIRRIEGCVTARNGGLDGWAWHPGDPTIDPVMTVAAASGEELHDGSVPSARDRRRGPNGQPARPGSRAAWRGRRRRCGTGKLPCRSAACPRHCRETTPRSAVAWSARA